MARPELSTLRQYVAAKNEEIKELKSQVEQMIPDTHSLNDIRNNYVQCADEIDALRQEMELQLTHAGSDRTTLCIEVEHALTIARLQKLRAPQGENTELTIALTDARHTLDNTRAQLASASAPTLADPGIEDELGQRLAAAQAESAKVNVVPAATKVQLEVTETDVQAKAATIPQLTTTDQRKGDEIAKLQGKLSALQRDGEASKAQQELIDKSQRVQEQERLIVRQQNRLNEANGEIIALKTSHGALASTAGDQQRMLETLTARLGDTLGSEGRTCGARVTDGGCD